MTPLEQIVHAKLQIAFAIKMMMYVELGKVNREEFDGDAQVNLRKQNIPFPRDMFPTQGHMITLVQNNFRACLCVNAIGLDTALTQLGLPGDLGKTHPLRDLRALVYMIRCAVAHNPLFPEWRAKPKFQRVLSVNLPSGPLSVDVAILNNKPFHEDHIGGFETYWEIADEIEKLAGKQP